MLGSVNNTIALSDTLNGLNGYSVDSTLNKENIWNNMVAQNNQISGKPIGYTSAGGLVVADYLNEPQKVSNDTLKDQYVMQLYNQGLVYNGNIPYSTFSQGMQQGMIAAGESMLG